MASTIIRRAIMHLNFGATSLDLSCYTTAFELAPETETIDIGTFCNPSASTLGRTTYTATVSLLWEPAVYTLLQPHIGETGQAVFSPDAALPLEFIRFDTKYGSQPWGRFEIGQRVEVELPLAVLTVPTWGGTLLAEEPAVQPAEPEVPAA
jgi:hypothetical protein